MVAQIPGMKRFSQVYKNQQFDDVAANKEILRKMGFVPLDAEKFASNPEQMKNIVDYWYMRKTVGTRGVNYDPQFGAKYEDVMSAVRQYGNGSASGGGGNTILGGTYGGFTRRHTSYGAYEPLVDKNTATFDDVFNAFEREKTIWGDRAAVNDAIEKTLNEHNISLTDAMMYKDGNYDSRFTDEIWKLQERGIVSHEEADQIVTEIAEKLGVSGVRGGAYGGGSRFVGDYFGGMQKPKNVAYRNIDSNVHN